MVATWGPKQRAWQAHATSIPCVLITRLRACTSWLVGISASTHVRGTLAGTCREAEPSLCMWQDLLTPTTCSAKLSPTWALARHAPPACSTCKPPLLMVSKQHHHRIICSRLGLLKRCPKLSNCCNEGLTLMFGAAVCPADLETNCNDRRG